MISNTKNNSFYRPIIIRNDKVHHTFILVLITLYIVILAEPIYNRTIAPYGQILDCKKFTSYNHNPCTKAVRHDLPNLDSHTDNPSNLESIFDADIFDRRQDSEKNEPLARPKRQIDSVASLSSSIESPLAVADKCNSIRGQETSYVCVPYNRSSLVSSSRQKVDRKNDKNWKPLEVYIEPLEVNTTQLQSGSSLTVKCRFSATTLDQDLKFKLKWLRSVAGAQGYNQSILPKLPSNPNPNPLSISITTPRVSVLQRDGGLDLEVNGFQENDSGEYFCQAISDEDGSDWIIDEKRVQLLLSNQPSTSRYGDGLLAEADDQASGRSFYAQENLNRLLPSLKVIPSYVDAMPGETVRLSCITTDEREPEPKANQLSWSFEPFDRRAPFKVWTTNADDSKQLPENVLVYGNLLVVNTFSDEQRGFYKCTYKMPEFDLSVQASGEISARPTTDSAPLVFVSPELVRLSSDGSTRLQCESTGFPAPSLSWYRIESSNTTDSNNQVDSLDRIDGIRVEQMDSKDAMTYCEHSGSCASLKNQPPGSRLVTGLKWIEIKHARAHHQGQYVCRATNKHGSNQASTLVDVEFRQQPHVSIMPPEKRHQTLELPAIEYDLQRQQVPQLVLATFRCTVDMGRPKPRLRWLRPAPSATASSHIRHKLVTNSLVQTGHWSQFNELSKSPPKQSSSFDIYDLTRGVSSATSKVSTWLEDNGNTLVLSIGTISTDDEGDYVCLAENEAGSHSTVAHLIVRRPAQVRIQQPSPQLARPGQSFQLDCIASGHPAPLDIEWSRLDKGAYFSLIARQSMTSTSTASLSHNGTSTPLVAISERAILKFDKVTLDDSGEYTCNARDPMNESKILQDTIMVLVEEPQAINDSSSNKTGHSFPADNEEQLKLMIRPTKLSVPIGSNVTLDCLAVGGLQPTVVEWLAPPLVSTNTGSLTINKEARKNDCCDDPKSSMRFGGGLTLSLVQPYYRGTIGAKSIDGSWAFQFGSKLRIFNITKAHGGVYQCKGRNKVGTESAPALISVTDKRVPIDAVISGREKQTLVDETTDAIPDGNASMTVKGIGLSEPPAIKTKIARAGSNIELRCQVNGVGQQPATSWSRDGLELPLGSVQIEHNLWIQNLTASDEGLYVCSARSDEPNRIIQARIHLLVRPASDAIGEASQQSGKPLDNLRAKIVASKSSPKSGDSITLECIIELQNSTSDSANVDLGALERQSIWTNLHSGESLFQDNVYVQENLLIIYGLRYENEAIYRCNYNELTQHVDYRLILADQYRSSLKQIETSSGDDEYAKGSNYSTEQPIDSRRLITSSSGQQIELRSYAVGSRLVLDCASNGSDGAYLPARTYNWYKVQEKQLVESNTSAGIMVIESIGTGDASVYYCYEMTINGNHKNTTDTRLVRSVLVQVQTVAAKFTQKPKSFVTLPAITNADQRLELELKFLPERSHGLILFSGPQQQQSQASIISQVNAGLRNDFILLGMQRGQLEFRFELGDGVTTVKSNQILTLHQWHKVVIERYRRSATMWIDGQVAATNSSNGKFFNLNLDSVLYVGGNHYFQDAQSQYEQTSNLRDSLNTNYNTNNNSSNKQPPRFYGYSNGFYGCIASLKINRRAPVPLLARGRSVSVGVFECDRSECGRGTASSGSLDCGRNGICQVERPAKYQPDKQRASLVYNDLRCICVPNFVGDQCDAKSQQVAPMSLLSSFQAKNRTTTSNQPPLQSPRKQLPTAVVTTTTTGACEVMTSLSSSGPCSLTGALECESLTSTSFKCHCRLGFMGDLCDQTADFGSVASGDKDQNETYGETGIWFNGPAYLHLRLNNQTEAENHVLSSNNIDALQVVAHFNGTQYARQISMTDRQNITFHFKTRASFGLLFYMGAHFANLENNDLSSTNLTDDLIRKSINSTPMQGSKSMVANLLARLSTQSVVDYLSIALIDGHIELSYELGSGLAIIRSSRRFNDGQSHKITVLREARFGRMSVDDEMRFQGESPGRLSMLNGAGTNEIYLGGLPLLSHLKSWRRNSSSTTIDDNSTATIAAASLTGTAISYLPGAFSGCISQVHLNELGPLNLVRSDFRSRVQAARNLVPCNSPFRNEQQQLSSSVLAAQQLLSAASSSSSSSAGAGSNGSNSTNGADTRRSHQKQSTATTTSAPSDMSDDSDET